MKQLIATLRYAGRIGNADDADVVKRVTEEVAIETKRLERQKKATERNDASDLGDKILALLQGRLAGVPAK